VVRQNPIRCVPFRRFLLQARMVESYALGNTIWSSPVYEKGEYTHDTQMALLIAE